MPNDALQLYAAHELYERGWRYHKEHKLWFTRVPGVETTTQPGVSERGSYFFFDVNGWEKVRKDNFSLRYELLDGAPLVPS